MGLFSKKSVKLDYLTISNSFFNDFIFIEVIEDIKRFNIKESKIDIFTHKMRIYKSAIVLISLLSEEQRDKNYSPLCDEFEKLLFQNKETDFLAEIKNAMSDLNVLLFSYNKKELSWSKKWFQQIEIDEFNPVQLTLFAMTIMEYYNVIINLLRKEFKPF